jgi:hypothetical protein
VKLMILSLTCSKICFPPDRRLTRKFIIS